jgi:hypothetical protein
LKVFHSTVKKERGNHYLSLQPSIIMVVALHINSKDLDFIEDDEAKE